MSITSPIDTVLAGIGLYSNRNAMPNKNTHTSSTVKVLASLLAADQAALGAAARRAQDAGCDGLHLDVIDGRFANTFGLSSAAAMAIKPWSTLPIDAHLMVERPLGLVDSFAAAGVHTFAVHATSADAEEALRGAAKAGMRPALAVTEHDDVTALLPLLALARRILVLTVPPGFSGQRAAAAGLCQVRKVGKLILEQGLELEIAVDGGINAETRDEAVAAGARWLVSGSYLFSAENMAAKVSLMRTGHSQ